MSLNQLSLKHLLQSYRGFAILFTILAFVGFLDAMFLTIEHVLEAPVPCSIIGGCETVLTSTYSEIGGIPVAFFGVLYYASIFLLALLSLTRMEKKYVVLASKLTFAGLCVSLVLVFLQLFVIKAICVYCMLSALTSMALFVAGMFALRQNKKWEIISQP